MSESTHDFPHEMNDDPNPSQVMTPDSDDDFAGDDEFGDEAGRPGRPQRVVVNRWTALLAAIVIGGACFYGGVRVEKSQVAGTSTSTARGFAGLASRFTAASGASGSATGARGGGFGAGGGGFAGAAGAAGGGATTGTISTIDGDTLDISETGGNTVKVKLSAGTTLKKTSTVARSKLFPGDTVAVTGTTGSGGTITATALTDSGSASSGTNSTGTSSSGTSGSSGSSALNSLFGG